MKTIKDVLLLSTEYLQKKNISQARRQSEDLLCDLLGKSRMELYLHFDQPLTETELDHYRTRLRRCGMGEPLAYIHGEVDFYDCTIRVNPNVLIPRPETELLVDRIVQQLKTENLKGKILLDLCTGSGCIGIALKKTLPELTVFLADISPKALALAQENARLNQVEVAFLEGDLLHSFQGEKAHFIVSNPPYISEKEYKELDGAVRDYEPAQALVAGPKGIEFYERIAQELQHYLLPQGKAWLEIGHSQGEAVLQLFQAAGWSHCLVENDWSGHNRFFSLENE